MNSRNVDHLAHQAATLGCAALVDAIGRLYGHRAHLLPLVSPDPERTAFGRAVTMQYLPYREDVEPRTFADVFDEAVGSAAPGRRVLLISSGGYRDVSHGGGIKLARAQHHHFAGVVADGRLRDFDQLRGSGFATWCRGEAVRWGGDTVMPHAANVAVEFGGVCVVPGDYLYVDAAGGVVIPADRVSAVFDVAREVDREDATSLAAIRGEAKPLPVSPEPSTGASNGPDAGAAAGTAA